MWNFLLITWESLFYRTMRRCPAMKCCKLTISSCIQRSSCLPDENNVAALQEEVKQSKLRELETLRSFREMQDAVTELNQRWQVTQSPRLPPSCTVWQRLSSGSPAAHQRLTPSLTSTASHVPREQHGRRRRRGPLEGIPQEERHERAAGQTDDGQAEGGRGSGWTPRGQT